MIIVAALVIASGSTAAYFTSTATIADNQIQTGTLKVIIGEPVNKPVQVTNMAPGDSTSGHFSIKNDGSLPQEQYIYLDNLVANPNDTTLQDILDFEMKILPAGETDCSNPSAKLIYQGKLKDFVGTNKAQKISDKSSVATNSAKDSVIDNIDPGLWAGRICQTISMPTSADNNVQGKSLTFNEVVYASQDWNPDIAP